MPGFTTPAPLGTQVPWSRIAWRKLAADDPLGQVRSVLRWRGGYVAVGAPLASGNTSRTPVWLSTDGATWRPLGTDTLGPSTLVVGLAEAPTGLVALTLQGGANQCNDGAPMDCWALSLPFQAWTSSDGAIWTAHPGPDVSLLDEDGTGHIPPVLVPGGPLLVLLDWEPNGFRAATSRDGLSWEIQRPGTFSTQFEFRQGSVAWFRSRIVAVGEAAAGDTVRAIEDSSANGRAWSTQRLPRAGFRPGWLGVHDGTSASQLVAGSRGLIATGSVASTPGGTLWWSSLDGRAWKAVPDLTPLGIWRGEGAGTGQMPNGDLVGDGERILAYRSDGKDAAWTSFDGRHWRPLSIAGKQPPKRWREPPILLPFGVLWLATDGSTWFGSPSP